MLLKFLPSAVKGSSWPHTTDIRADNETENGNLFDTSNKHIH